MGIDSDTTWIRARALSLGFDLCGVVRAEKFPELAHTEEWLERGYAGEMKYLEDSRRGDPRQAMAGVRSAIVCALNYNTAHPRSIDPGNGMEESGLQEDGPPGWISRYAWGDDYHDVLREKLDKLLASLRAHFVEAFEARIYADTGPVQERVLGKYAGLGWLGKNTLLLNQKIGSWTFLGTILTNLELAPTLEGSELPPPDLCGSCRKCIDACPTQAIVEPYLLDARRCISYLTIELRGDIPEELREPMGRHVFGCDICQDVCPWNRRAPVSRIREFQPRVFPASEVSGNGEQPRAGGSEGEQFRGKQREPRALLATQESDANELPCADERQYESLLLPRLEWLAAMSEEEYRKAFRGSPIKRAKWRGLIRNACIALGNSELKPGTIEHARVSKLLQQLTDSREESVAESALWALSRIQ